MKLLLVAPSFYPATIYGGPTFSTLYTCKYISLMGVEVLVATTNVNREKRLSVNTNDWVSLEGFSVRYFKETITDRFSLDMFLNLRNIIKNVDVVHLQPIFNFSTLYTLYYCKKENKPVFISPRGSLGFWIMNHGIKFKYYWLKILRPLVKNIYWFATSKQESDEIISHYPNAKIFIIPNGIELDKYEKVDNSIRKEIWRKIGLPIKSNIPVVLSLGRYHPKKGYDILIDAIYILKKKKIDIYLIIAGDDEGIKDVLKQKVRSMDLESNIFLIDSVHNEEKVALLQESSLFALTSHNENFGNVYLEALASGTPILASTNTPWNNVKELGCGETVELIPEHIASSIISLLSLNRDQVRINAINYAKNFSWSMIAKKYIKVYETILGKDKIYEK